jgi:hypothetical protein
MSVSGAGRFTGDEIGVSALLEPPATDNELLAEVAEMSNRATE